MTPSAPSIEPTPPIPHPAGITTLDACYVRSGLASIHLIVRDGHACVVDTGTVHSVPQVLGALARLGLEPAAVEKIFVTHAHLDHAGGLGALMRELPRARAVVHPRAAPHLVDPERLEAATRAVYGDGLFERLYGGLVPAPPERVDETTDGGSIELGASRMRVLHTPGHALHHHVLFDPDASAVFTGDTFGLAYPELQGPAGPLVLPTTTPSQFDPEQLEGSIRRIAALGAESAYVTHYGRLAGLAAQTDELVSALQECVEIAERCGPEPPAIESELRAAWRRRAAAHGCPLEGAAFDAVVEGDLSLNAQGLAVWLARRRKSR